MIFIEFTVQSRSLIQFRHRYHIKINIRIVKLIHRELLELLQVSVINNAVTEKIKIIFANEAEFVF